MTCEQVGELLLEVVEGDARDADAQAVHAHVQRCESCRRQMEHTRAILADLNRARDTDVSSGALDPTTTSRGAAPPPAAGPHPRRIGDFAILEEIGRGGMGVVYRARQISLNRLVALKVLSHTLTCSERLVTRFLREAQAAARLHHTNIVPIYAQGRDGDLYYYAMELIDGRSLDAVFAEQRRLLAAPGGSRAAAAAHVCLSGADGYRGLARLMAEVAEALHHAHELGIVHRDIKPQNLLLGEDGRLHITDFGLARVLDEPALTRSEETLGTPAYMPPEQISGGRDAVDRRADVYSLGVALYEALTLRRPFAAETYDGLLHQILTRDPPPPRRAVRHVPIDLETICLRAMEKAPSRRFQTAAELARDLRRFADDAPIQSRRMGPLGKLWRWTRRHPARAAACTATAAVLVLAPVSVWAVRAHANECLDAAWKVLLSNYRHRDQALARLDWLTRAAGDPYRVAMVRAFADVQDDAGHAERMLREALRIRPNDADATFLLAWLLSRNGRLDEAQSAIRSGRAVAARPSDAGYFFLAQALVPIDLPEAIETFGTAITLGSSFTQAALHQARARNHLMYLAPETSDQQFDEVRSTLRLSCTLEAEGAYPRYLMSTAYLLRAVYLVRRNEPSDRDAALALFDEALHWARDAQRTQPANPRGYVAEASYFEDRGVYAPTTERLADFGRALDLYRQAAALEITASDWGEVSAYGMRLAYWLAQYDEAQRLCEIRFSARSNYDAHRDFNAEETVHRVALAAARGDHAAIQRILSQDLGRCGSSVLDRIRLETAYVLGGRAVPPELWREPRDASTGGERSLLRFARGELAWDDVRVHLEGLDRFVKHNRSLLSAAHLLRAVRLLSAGDRGGAQAELLRCADCRDVEEFCFLGKMLWVKSDVDQAWPAISAAAD